jgi:arylsulfatase A-like enzyme
MYEEVMQTSMISSWPGRVPVEGARPELVSFYDLLPSVCDATDTPPPANRNLCGRSYLPMALNKSFPRDEQWRKRRLRALPEHRDGARSAL